MTPDERDRLTRVETQVEGLIADIHEIKVSVKTIADTVTQAKGGWRMLLSVTTLSGGIGAIAGFFGASWPLGK